MSTRQVAEAVAGLRALRAGGPDGVPSLRIAPSREDVAAGADAVEGKSLLIIDSAACCLDESVHVI